MPVTRRSHTRRRPSALSSPHATSALPSPETATRERCTPRPAARAGTTSIGTPIVCQATSCSRATRTSAPPPPGAAQVAYAVPLMPMSIAGSLVAPDGSLKISVGPSSGPDGPLPATTAP